MCYVSVCVYPCDCLGHSTNILVAYRSLLLSDIGRVLEVWLINSEKAAGKIIPVYVIKETAFRVYVCHGQLLRKQRETGCRNNMKQTSRPSQSVPMFLVHLPVLACTKMRCFALEIKVLRREQIFSWRRQCSKCQ